MRHRSVLAVILLFSLLSTGFAFAGGKGSGSHSGSHSAGYSHSHSSGGSVHVKGYYRKDGTNVRGHNRAAPSQGRSTSSVTPRSYSHNATSRNTDFSSVVPHGAKAVTVRPGETMSIRNGTALKKDSKGHTVRSSEARAHFMKLHPCPSTGKTSGACPGYVVDHITALKRGGADDPSNMQWQTVEAAKAKDKIE